MNYSIVKTLILKDWYLQRWPILGCLAGGVLALSILAVSSQGAAFAGSILLITVMIIAGVHVAMAPILGERKEQTLAFIMSLPVSSSDYTAAKLIGGTLLLLLPWTTLMLGSFAVISASSSLPDGLIPFMVVMLTELLASAFVLLGVALVTESQGWTMSVMVCGNLFVNGFLYYVIRIPSLQREMAGPVPIWSPTVMTLLLAELAVIAVALGLAFYLQSRKTDFL